MSWRTRLRRAGRGRSVMTQPGPLQGSPSGAVSDSPRQYLIDAGFEADGDDPPDYRGLAVRLSEWANLAWRYLTLDGALNGGAALLGEAAEALHRAADTDEECDYTLCPWYTRTGTCGFGCVDEPVCETGGPNPMDAHPLVVMWRRRAGERGREIDGLLRASGHEPRRPTFEEPG